MFFDAQKAFAKIQHPFMKKIADIRNTPQHNKVSLQQTHCQHQPKWKKKQFYKNQEQGNIVHFIHFYLIQHLKS